jgi:hypothetical protein
MGDERESIRGEIGRGDVIIDGSLYDSGDDVRVIGREIAESEVRLTEVAAALDKPYRLIYTIVTGGPAKDFRVGKGGEFKLDWLSIASLRGALRLRKNLGTGIATRFYEYARKVLSDAPADRYVFSVSNDVIKTFIPTTDEQETKLLRESAQHAEPALLLDVRTELEDFRSKLEHLRSDNPKRRRGRPRMSDERYQEAMAQADEFSSKDASQEEINELI